MEPVTTVTMPLYPLQEDLTAILDTVFPGYPWDDNVAETARRVLAYWREFSPQREISFNWTTFPASSSQMVIVKGMEFSSLCAHHLLPFFGIVDIAYIPGERMVGLSKIPRLVDYWAKRPQTQETLTVQIAEDLEERLRTQGIAVCIESRHTCMSCRGVEKTNAAMITSFVSGYFKDSIAARAEFLSLAGRTNL